MFSNIATMFSKYAYYAHHHPIIALCSTLITSYVIFCLLGILLCLLHSFIIDAKIKMWEKASEDHALEEIQYIIRKHNECADLDTLESTIEESINLTTHSGPYRTECYKTGLTKRVRSIEKI